MIVAHASRRWWLLPIALGILLAGPVVVGLLAGLFEVTSGASVSPASLGFRGGEALRGSLAWSFAIGAAASVLGLGPGRRLAARATSPWAVACLLPLLLSPALFFDAWWLEVGPDTWLGRWAAEGDRVPLLRRAVLALGLCGTAIPLAAWCHAAAGMPGWIALHAMDRPRGPAGWLAFLRREAPNLSRTTVIVSLVLVGLTVPFDLAQVPTWGFELRSLDTRGANAGTLLRAGWWTLPAAVIAAGLLVDLGRVRPRGRRRRLVSGEARAIRGLRDGVVLLWFVVVPVSFLVARAIPEDTWTGWEVAWRLHGPAVAGTGVVAACGAMGGALVATTAMALRAAGPRGDAWARIWVGVLATILFLPSTLVAVGVETTFNRPFFGDLYDGPLPMLLAVTARVSLVPAIVGALLVPTVGRIAGGPIRLDAPSRLATLVAATRPVWIRAALAGGVAGGVLAAGEIPVAARLQPPGWPLLSSALLDAMHYQYVDSVLPVALAFAGLAIPAAIAITWLLARSGRSGSGASMLLLALVVVGCGPVEPDGGGPPAVPHDVAFGRPGNLDGRFDYPRAIALDRERNRLYVVDKSARVQRFDLAGRFERSWRMPRFENGKPTGITIARDGRVVVADTHEHRVAIFSPDGELLETHGRMGTGPGEFIYPTDVVEGPAGRWFVSEYGGNDRVQVFDEDWRPVGVIGFLGGEDEGDRPAFSRPQSMAWSGDREELFIADSIHHRVVVVDPEGRIRRILGGPGLEPGRFSYPYGVALDDDGTLLVAEYGANRVQRVDPVTGRTIAMVGGTGIEPGRLRYPWGVDVDDGLMAVLDSGNSRVLLGPTPAPGLGLDR